MKIKRGVVAGVSFAAWLGVAACGAGESKDGATSTVDGVECSEDVDCEVGKACVDFQCVVTCLETADCPSGSFCSPDSQQCALKQCTADAQCTDGERTVCDATYFECREPAPSIAPVIEGFRASPPAVVYGESTPVTWVWSFGATKPYPEVSCSIDKGVGAVTQNSVAAVTSTSLLPVTYTLTCTNSAGSATASVTVPAVASTPVTFEIPPTGGTYDFGVATLEVPANALPTPTPITARFSGVFDPSPNLVSLPVEFYPNGLQFLTPVTLTLPVDTTILAAAGWSSDISGLHVATTGEGDWAVRILTEVDATAHTLTATIGHFSSVAASDSEQGSCDAPPLSVPKKSLVRRDELLRLGGVDWSEYDVYGQVYDDMKQTDRDRMADVLEPMVVNNTDGAFRKAATGDFDGDGRAETAVATTYTVDGHGRVQVSILDSCHSSADAGSCWNDFTVVKTFPGEDDNAISEAQVATGDVDGDGLDEIVYAASVGWKLWMFVIDDATANWEVLGNVMMTDTADVRIAVGDMDSTSSGATKKDEIALAYTRRYVGQYNIWQTRVYRLNSTNDGLDRIAEVSGSSTSNLSRPNVAMADIDNDGNAELGVVRFKRNSGQRLALTAYRLDASGAVLNQIAVLDYDTPFQHYWYSDSTPLIAGSDQNGDGKAEFWVLHRDFYNGFPMQYYTRVLHVALGDATAPWGLTGARVLDDFTRSEGAHDIAVGDFDGDLREELAVAELRPDKRQYDFAIYGGSGDGYKTTAIEKAWRSNVGTRKLAPVIAAGDFDGDNLTLKYTGSCTTRKTDPRPVVAMAAPPVGLALAQYREDSATEYGSSTETSQTSSNSVSSSASVTLSLSVEALGGMFEASASTSFEREFTKTKTQSTSITVGQQFSAPWIDDNYHNYVIYLVTEYTSYKYEIVAAPNADALTEANKYMTIDVPQGTDNFPTTQETYNNGLDPELQIGSETFVHTLGDPSSYRTYYACDDLISGGNGWRTGGQYIGENIAVTESLDMSTTSATAEERSMSVQQTAGTSIAGVGYEASRGYGSSSVYEVSIGENTSYSGTVGGIDSNTGNWSADKYKFWLVVYKKKRSDSFAYTVIDYCVYRP